MKNVMQVEILWNILQTENLFISNWPTCQMFLTPAQFAFKIIIITTRVIKIQAIKTAWHANVSTLT